MISSDSQPRLKRGVRLVHNESHGGWVLLAPEKIFKTDEIGAEILQRCNGVVTLENIVKDLAAKFAAPAEQIQSDVIELLQTLKSKQLLEI